MTSKPVTSVAQPLVLTQQTEEQQLKGALSDTDVHRILAHRRAYLKHQRAFDRACIGGSHIEFDPTQVWLSRMPVVK